ncbi:unnamed protein product [Acanthoscelides obtectus]|uniref:Uncharacterized protein n=1 Tax=Acanthoscelides obtectus TaxID=200917 RepID=A0A9P0PF99_ACAOB|nr:unnamed protein product [Acanthoscelides obtectus]CAK1654556.1 hypothetical protein AOBTE_LOCUS18674 [Acanthoscelides obtectus]
MVDFSALENNVRIIDANEYAVNNPLLLGDRPSPVTNRFSGNEIGLNDIESTIFIDESAGMGVPDKSSDFFNVTEDWIPYNNYENPYESIVNFSALENHVRINEANEYAINNILLPGGCPSPVTDRSSSNGIGLNDTESMILIDEGAGNPVPDKTSDFPNVTEGWIQYNKEENIYQLTQQTVDFSALENNVRINEANEYVVNNILLPGGCHSPVTDRSSSNGIGLNDIESMILIDEGAGNTVPDKTSDFPNVTEGWIQYNREENIYQLNTPVEADAEVVLIPNEQCMTAESSVSPLLLRPEPSASIPSTTESAKPIDIPMVPTRKYSRIPVFAPKREHPSCKVEESKETKNELKRATEGILQPPSSKFAKVASGASQIETKLELSTLVEEYSPKSEARGHTAKPLFNNTTNNSDSVVHQSMYDVIKLGNGRSRSSNKEKEARQPKAKSRKSTYSSTSGITIEFYRPHDYPHDNRDSRNPQSTYSSNSSAHHSQSYYPSSGLAYKSADYGHQERLSKTLDADPLKELPYPKETYENEKHAQQASSNSGGPEWYRIFY